MRKKELRWLCKELKNRLKTERHFSNMIESNYDSLVLDYQAVEKENAILRVENEELKERRVAPCFIVD